MRKRVGGAGRSAALCGHDPPRLRKECAFVDYAHSTITVTTGCITLAIPSEPIRLNSNVSR